MFILHITINLNHLLYCAMCRNQARFQKFIKEDKILQNAQLLSSIAWLKSLTHTCLELHAIIIVFFSLQKKCSYQNIVRCS